MTVIRGSSGRRRERWILPALAVLALGIVALRMRGEPNAEPAAPFEAVAPLPTALVFWHEDAAGLYDVTWKTTSSTALLETGPASTSVDIEAAVETFDAGRVGTQQLVGLRIAKVVRARATAFEKDLLGDEAEQRRELEGKEVVLSMTPRGTVENVWVANDATPLAKNLLQPLALHFAMALPEDDAGAWVATEQSDYGPLVWAYTKGDGRLRRTLREPGVVGEGEVDFTAGLPSRIATTTTITWNRGEQTASAAKSFFSATRRETRGERSPRSIDLTRFVKHAPNERPTEVDERNANLMLANGLTIEDMVAMVLEHGAGRGPKKGNVMRSAALLRANPELCDELAKTFANDAIGEHGRELVIDLLASSGDPKAQTVLRALLVMPIVSRDRDHFERLVQRFALVADPAAESITFVRSAWLEARRAKERRIRQATVYTLGAMAGHAHARERDGLAVPVVNELLGVLRATKDEDEERGIIAALGNAGMEQGLDPILARAAASDYQTRSQVATSLRKFDSPPIRRRLIELLGDPDAGVALAAVRSLDIQRIGVPELSFLAERITADKLHPDCDATLVGVVATHAVDGPLVVRILKTLRVRAEGRAELLVQIDQAIATIEGARTR